MCKICGGATAHACDVTGEFSGRAFTIERCSACGLSFVIDPWLEFDKIYNDDYYRGLGADPLVNYFEELENPLRTVRQYEWAGIRRAVASLVRVGESTRWLDYGCGLGGLVDDLRRHGVQGAAGFEEGWSVSRLATRGVPLITPADEARHTESFDVVTAIEVIEHTVDPVAELRRMRRFLRTGGLLFLTTGNAAPYRGRLARWRYVRPEIHISYFEPKTLAVALRKAGFEPTFPGFTPGWSEIIRYKMLKSAGRRHVHALDRLVPWGVLTRAVDGRLGLTAHPVGWAS